MNQKIPPEVLNAFINYDLSYTDEHVSIQVVNGGLINHSYRIHYWQLPDMLLQRFNQQVFTRPEDVQQNYISIREYAEFEFTGLQLPAPKYCTNGTTLFVDNQKNYWRAFEFIDDSKMCLIAEDPAQAKATANTFATFTAAFEEFNIHLLKEVIPGFHDLSLRYHQFEESLKGESFERIAKALPLIEELKARVKYKYFYEIITESEEFRRRVMHHDAKIANVLFNNTTGKVICPVDFDTVMPGYYFSDLGDMIRSLTSPEDESSTDYDKIVIRKEFYEAIITGYLDIMNKQLTKAEKKYIHYSGLLIIYMQALRFLTDYLNGDTYYHIDYPEQNFNRAKNQLTLLQKLEDFLFVEYKLKYD